MARRISKKALKKESTPKSKGRVQKKVNRTEQSSAHANMTSLQRNIGNRGVGQLLQSETGSAAHTVDNVPPIVESVLNSDRGQALDATTRESMESRFGQDLSQVRIHTGAEAAEAAEAVNALAYTAGQNVVFGPGQFAPQTSEGQKLLAHELTHTIQQRDAGLSSSSAAKGSPTIMRAPKPGAPTLRLFASQIPEPIITRTANGIMATVYFGQNDFLLESANFTAVEGLSEELSLMMNPTVMVEGYASGEGTAEHNLRLSELRRQTVIAILRSKLASRTSLEIGGQAHGESAAAESETASEVQALEEQRRQNRRVEIFIFPAPVPEATSPRGPIRLFPTPEELQRIIDDPNVSPEQRDLSRLLRETGPPRSTDAAGLNDLAEKIKKRIELRAGDYVIKPDLGTILGGLRELLGL